jgi:hypothetical protein
VEGKCVTGPESGDPAPQGGARAAESAAVDGQHGGELGAREDGLAGVLAVVEGGIGGTLQQGQLVDTEDGGIGGPRPRRPPRRPGRRRGRRACAASAGRGPALPFAVSGAMSSRSCCSWKPMRSPPAKPTSWSQDHVPFDALMGIGGLEGMTSLLDTPYLVKEWGLSSPIVLLSGDGHCWIGLDYRGRGPDSDPSVEHDLLPRLKWGPVPAARVGPPG